MNCLKKMVVGFAKGRSTEEKQKRGECVCIKCEDGGVLSGRCTKWQDMWAHNESQPKQHDMSITPSGPTCVV